MYKILNKQTSIIDDTVRIGNNVIIYPNNIIQGNTEIKDNSIIYPGNVICDSTIGENTVIKTSYIYNSIIGKECAIGPFAHLRESNIIGDRCKIGNFCELKKCKIGSGTKISHLSYLGDIDIGNNCNVGAGVIVANFDGVKKYHSVVGNNVFLGCNSNIISPVWVADNTFVCAGTTLTHNTNVGDFVIGRMRETTKPNYKKEGA